MKTKIFTVYDTKCHAYLPPFFMQSTGQAMRAFEDTIADKTTQFSKHPEDFILFELGTYDDSTATFDIYKTHITLAKAIELCVAPEPELFELKKEG
jgi:hypothetical protein